MADKEFYLKHVKSNPREVSKTVYNGGTFRGRTVKSTEHDHALHHPDTGEPIFSLTKKSWSKGYHMDWHPYMKDTHPDLERSFEHGSRHPEHDKMRDVDSLDSAKYAGTRRYEAAARSGFKDTLDVRTQALPTEENPHAFINHYHDPETGQKIGHSSSENHKLMYSKNYLDSHGIDHGVVGALPGKSPYQKAQALMGEKGKSYSLIGHKQIASRKQVYGRGEYSNDTGAPHADVYKGGVGKSDEEMSAAHEAHVREKAGGLENFAVERHTPTVFTATHTDSKWKYPQHVTSIASKGQLIAHKIPDTTEGEKMEHKIS